MSIEETDEQTAVADAAIDESMELYDGPSEEPTGEPPAAEPASAPSAEPASEPVSEPEPAGTPETEPATPSETPAVSDRMIAAAERIGMGRQEASSFSSDASLQDYLNHVSAQFARSAAERAQADARAPSEEFKPPEFEPFKLDESLVEELDPKLVKIIQSQDEHYRSQMARMQQDVIDTFQQFSGPIQVAQQQAVESSNREYVREFDSLIGEVGTAYKELVGDGTSAELSTRNGTEWQNRLMLDSHYQAQLTAYQNMPPGMPRPSHAQLMRMALTAAFGDRTKEEARTEVSNAIEEQANRAVNRPTARKGRNGTPGNVYQEAKEALRQRFLELGLDPGPETESISDMAEGDVYV